MSEFFKSPMINGVAVPYDASIKELKNRLSGPMKDYVVCLRALAWKEDRASFNILKNELRNPDYYCRRAALENISYHKLWKQNTDLVRELLLDHSEYVVKLALKLLNENGDCDVINEVVLVCDFWKGNTVIEQECRNYFEKRQVDYVYLMFEYQNQKQNRGDLDLYYWGSAQTKPIGNWKENKKMSEYLTVIQQHLPDYSIEDAQVLLYTLSEEGCGYAAIVSTLILFFQRHHYDFSRMFGFPMYDAMLQLNADLLLLHFYCMTDEEGYGMTIGQLMGRFYKFIKTYGLKGRMELLLHIKPGQLKQPDTYIIILTKNFILLDKQRKKHYVEEWHYMNLREMDKDGNFLVSSWGENYMLRKADIMERMFFIRVRYLASEG